MKNSISYNQITVQNGKIEKINNNHFKFTLKNEHDYPIILYKSIDNLDTINNLDQIYKTTLESWVKLYKNFNFRNKVQFTPETKISIGKNIYKVKLYNTDLNAIKQPIMYFTTNKNNVDIPCGKFKEMKFIINFTSNVTPDLIRYFTPPQIDLPKANTISQNICYPYIQQLMPYNGFTYNGVYIKNIPTYNGIISLRSQPYLKNNYPKPVLPTYNGVTISKPTQQEIDNTITQVNLSYMYNYGNLLVNSGKVSL